MSVRSFAVRCDMRYVIASLLLLAITLFQPPTAHGQAAPVQIPSSDHLGRIMMMGDSITFGIQSFVPDADVLGYRHRLSDRLHQHGWTGAFVGSQETGLPLIPDRHHEGHPGSKIEYLWLGLPGIHADAATLVRNAAPTTVLLMAGSVDIANHLEDGAPERLMKLVDAIASTAPNADILVSTIPPQTSGPYTANVAPYNAAIWSMLQEKHRANPRIRPVNAGGSLTDTDILGGIHPSGPGYDHLGDGWWHAIEAAHHVNDPVQIPSGARATAID